MIKNRLPYLPVEYKSWVVTAIQQLEQGQCTPDLQKRILGWIIADVCATYQQSYFGDTNHTIFMEGRRFCGNTIVKMLKLDPGKVRSKE